jgi:hypothetical protein
MHWQRCDLIFNSPSFANLVNATPPDWQDSLEKLPSKDTSVQEMTTLPASSLR